jgi:hypothetical protein
MVPGSTQDQLYHGLATPVEPGLTRSVVPDAV